MIRACFFDFDGTLFSHTTKSIPSSTYKAFDKLKEKGIKRILCTGRHIRELETLGVLDMGLEFDGYILLNGQLILDKDFNYVDGTPIRESMKEIIVNIFNCKKVPLILETSDELYGNYIDDFYIEGLQSVNTDPFPIKEYDGKDIYQVSSYIKEDSRTFLREQLPDCFFTSWNKYGILIVDKDGGKSVGIKKYIKHFNINLNETMAFGDGDNDIDMLEHVNIGVAMGNGTINAKEASNYITDDIDDDGLYNALKHFEII